MQKAGFKTEEECARARDVVARKWFPHLDLNFPKACVCVRARARAVPASVCACVCEWVCEGAHGTRAVFRSGLMRCPQSTPKHTHRSQRTCHHPPKTEESQRRLTRSTSLYLSHQTRKGYRCYSYVWYGSTAKFRTWPVNLPASTFLPLRRTTLLLLV